MESQSDNAKTKVELAGKYQNKGQCLAYTVDADGNYKIVFSGNAPTYMVHQVGVRFTGAGGPGFTLSGGLTWDSHGNLGLYGSAGGAGGVDLSFGLEYIGNTSYDPDFNITDIRGTSEDMNFSGLYLDYSHGGDTRNMGFLQKAGANYSSDAVGGSVSGFHVGVTRTSENMGVGVLIKR